jgi:O-antigen ligase
VASIVLILGIFFVLDIKIPAPQSRVGEISVRGVVGRIIAPINEELASQYIDVADDAAATVSWRTDWWRAIWMRVHEQDSTALFGLGYGFPLSGLVPYIEAGTIRTPHNVFFYALGYGGWLGVILFYGLQFSLIAIFFRSTKTRGTIFAILVWVFTFVKAHFDNLFETPFGAIPYYLLIGLSLATVLREANNARITRPQPLSTTGR